MAGWWAQYDGLAMDRDGTVWRLGADDDRVIGHIEDGHGLDLSDREWRTWERLERDWKDAIHEHA